MMMHRHGFVPRGPKASPTDDPNDWHLADLAKELEMPLVTLYGWLRRGWLKARRVHGQWGRRRRSRRATATAKAAPRTSGHVELTSAPGLLESVAEMRALVTGA